MSSCYWSPSASEFTVFTRWKTGLVCRDGMESKGPVGMFWELLAEMVLGELTSLGQSELERSLVPPYSKCGLKTREMNIIRELGSLQYRSPQPRRAESESAFSQEPPVICRHVKENGQSAPSSYGLF